MQIFTKLDQERLLSRFNESIEKKNKSFAKSIAINKTARQKNLEDYLLVADKISEILSSIKVLDKVCSPSYAIDFSSAALENLTENKSAIIFSAMVYIGEGKSFSEKEIKRLYTALWDLQTGYVGIERGSKAYITIVFDKHEYEEPKPLQLDTYGAVKSYYETVLKPTEGIEPLGQSDISQTWNAAIEWYIEQQKTKLKPDGN